MRLLATILLFAVALGASEETVTPRGPHLRAQNKSEAKGKSEGKRKGQPRPGVQARPATLLVPFWKPSGLQGEAAPPTATIAGEAAPTVAVRTPESPLLLFVAIDFSDDLILTESAKQALAEAIASTRENVYVSLLRIPEQPMVITDPSTDREAFAQALKTLPMSGRAGLFEMAQVVSSVTDPVLRRHNVRAAILYLTDSEISNYREDYTNPVINSADSRDLSRRFPDALIREKVSTLSAALLRTSIPAFIVHLNYRNDTLNEAYQTGLKRVAESTGGRSVFCRSIAEIPVAIGDMVNAIQAMSLLELKLPASAAGSIAVQLEAPNGPLEYRATFDVPR